jgi:predicted glutamine amidotransferase
MCRLLGWAAAAPTPVTALLSDEELARLSALSRFHGDGWGISNGAQVVDRSTAPAHDDPRFDDALGTAASTGIVHLRRASPGYAVAPCNTHPFSDGGWTFAHNGTIARAERLDELLAPAFAARRRGETDSERYFLAVLQELGAGAAPVEAVRSVVASIRQRCGDNGLNAIACSDRYLLTVHAARGATPTRRALVELMGERVTEPGGGIAIDHLEDYFGLRYRLLPGGLVVASTGMPGADWSVLPEESVMLVDLADLSVELWPLEAGSGRRWSALLG